MKRLKYLAIVFASVMVFSCGSKEEKKSVAKAPTAPEMTETTTEPTKDITDDAVVEIMIHGTDKMTFDLKKIEVKAGQKVKLTLMHTGKMAKNVMGHNFVLLKNGVDMPTFASKAASASDHDYIPENTDAVIAYTKLLGGGEQDTIEFTAPEAGVYDFLCTFPGHYALMKGKFIVE
ncbi:azurin [Formosa haliotis]|uniref:azurin n=1 Tax=Formosa haliotis TaxID=1555194 RepID=UPI0008240684|nr:azurin [Formosa haliotis]